jgi:hypothetical protein
MNNKGIVISGGQFSATQVVVGDHASIDNDGWCNGSELLRKLDELLSVIQVAAIPPNKLEEMTRNINLINEQAKLVSPEKTVLENALRVIEKTAPSIAGIDTILASIKGILGL